MSDILKQVEKIVGKKALGFFLTTPNGYIDDRKPVDLLESDPEQVLRLAQAFAHPADVF